MMEQVKYVIIGGQKYEIEGQLQSLEDIKKVAVEYDPGLVNADVVVQGDTVSFVFRAGTKGTSTITKIIAGNREFEVDPEQHQNPQKIKDLMVEFDSTLSNTDYLVSGNTMTFIPKVNNRR